MKPLTGNAKSLLTTACLFFTITALQYVASLPQFANSLALRADCLSMFVDGLSYLGNLAAECYQESNSKKCVELSVAGLSLTLLLGFTVMFFFESLDEAFSKQHHHKAAAEEGGGSGGRDDADENGDSANNADDEGETVNPQIVIFFALLGLLFDSISLLTFKYCAGKEGGDNGSSRTLELMMMQQQQQQQQGREEEEWSVTNDEGGDDEEREEGGSLPTLAEFSLTSSSSLSTSSLSSSSSSSSVTKKKDMDFDQISLEPNHHNHHQGVDPTDINMLSALLHVGSDLLRSLTTLIEGVVILANPEMASAHVDGFAALAVCAIIAVGALIALVEWVRALHTDLVDHLEGSLLALAEGDDGRGGGSIKAFGRDREAGLYHQISIHGDEEEEAGEEGDGGDGGSEDISIMGGNLQAVVEADARQEIDKPGINIARQEEERAGGGLA